jgi:hypothetical protein
MFFIIHGIIFHDEVGHWLGNPRKKTKICVIYILPKIIKNVFLGGNIQHSTLNIERQLNWAIGR